MKNTWVRKDVWHLAEDLSEKSGLDVDSIYAFLMYCGKEKGCSPRKMTWTAGPGIVFLAGERDTYYLQTYRSYNPPAPSVYDGMADHYYNLIMDRQESWYDE